MEKEPQPESISTVTIKPEYPPSEVYGSEPPPAYHRPQSSAVQVAKIVAVTVVLVSVVLGSFILASAYVTANASCRQLEQELELLSEAADRFQPPPQPEALIQEAPLPVKRHSDPLQAEEEAPQRDAKEIETNSIDNDSDSNSDGKSSESSSYESNETEEEERTPIRFKLPLQLDFDDLAGTLIEKNQRSKMNCIVEKKRAEEVVDHQPKTIRLPFGVNLTTDPRFERLSGERMIIICESGHIQKAQPPPQPQPEEEEEEDTIMIQPVMIPIPHSPFQTHMAQQMAPVMQQQQEPQMIPMRPPMTHIHPMETMRPPMPPMMQPQVQIQPQSQPQPQPQQSEFPPNPILQHIVQQIIAQKILESEKAREEQQQQQQQPQAQMQELHPVVDIRPQHRFQAPQPAVEQRIPIPEEVLTQLNRLPNRDVIVAVSDPEADSESEEDSQEVRYMQEQRQNAVEMNGRQAYARGIPVHIPVQMMTQEQEQVPQQEQEQEPQAVASEEPRPHYVQPRSVRSVDALLKNQKREKRSCSCDCAC
ncbi:hypothetical protein NQ315_006203 [Exocentrus adspersus]|uniref:Uncharacterized protein n=1 Tax=Exocentrus adspersus TaxID=1586481 RepID=A0AAV8VZI4_9CUCU|nr:hypothetical protein NQ315_006203 [Exocentrus adspersus]